jgi:hypothetical protein
MSELTEELDRKTVVFWRTCAASPHFQKGIDWLRHNKHESDGTSDLQMIRAAAKWRGYMDALDDIQDKLTALPAKDNNLDEEPLNNQ